MDFLDRIRHLIFKLFLKSKQRLKHKRQPISLQNAKKIGILFDVISSKNNIKIIEFYEQLKKDLKTVDLLGFIPTNENTTDNYFPFFTQKDIKF